jgi:hypothetical protein
VDNTEYGELVQVVHEVAQRTGRDFGEVHHPSRGGGGANLTPGPGRLKADLADRCPWLEGGSYTPESHGPPADLSRPGAFVRGDHG